MEENKNKRIIAIDIIRITLMIVIFGFHAYIHMNCTYGVMTKFFANGSLVMSTFFMISGFTLFYTNYKKDMSSIGEIKKFYIKRVIGIYPAYIVIVILYLLFADTISFIKKGIVLPMDFMMLQSTVEGSFNTLHHGGTWFISCLFICYLLTPFIIQILKQLETKKIIKLGIIVYLICAYIPFVIKIMEYSSIYSNAIYRNLQFFIGAIVAAIYVKQNFEETKKYKRYSYVVLLIGIIILAMTQKYIDNNFQHNEYNDYLVIAISSAFVYISSSISFKGNLLQKVVNSKLIKYANEIAYEFFLAQFFCFKITLKIVSKISYFNINMIKIFLSFSICVIIAIIIHEIISKPCKKFFNNHLVTK